MPTFRWDLTLGNLLVALAFIASSWKVATIARVLVAPIREFIDEHDVLWEDYNIRTGGSYRRRTGRGSPPEPLDLSRPHLSTASTSQPSTRSDLDD